MTTLRLQPVSASTYSITQGRAKVGFVNKCPTGWVARIGTRCEVRPTAKAAFDAVAIPTLGFKSAGELQQHNSEVRQRNAARKNEMRHAVNEALGASNFDPLLDLFKKFS